MAVEKVQRNKNWTRLVERGYKLRDIAKLESVHWTTIYKATRKHLEVAANKKSAIS